jgi:hypothetical protein
MRISLTAGQIVVEATLADNQPARDLASLLPLRLRMRDLYGREKLGPLPRALAPGASPQHTYEVGDIAYWAPDNELAFFYHHDGRTIPDPGIVILGRIQSGVDAFHAHDATLEVTIKAIA